MKNDTDTPIPDVTLTESERRHAYTHLIYSKCYLEPDVERIIAAREQAVREEIAGEIEAARKIHVRTTVPASRQTPRERATSDALTLAQGVARGGAR